MIEAKVLKVSRLGHHEYSQQMATAGYSFRSEVIQVSSVLWIEAPRRLCRPKALLLPTPPRWWRAMRSVNRCLREE